MEEGNIFVRMPNFSLWKHIAACFLKRKQKPWTKERYLTHLTVVNREVLTVVSMKSAILWYVTPCTLVEVYSQFREHFLSIIQDVMVKIMSW